MTSRLIQIEGEAGLGKTRLLDELDGRLDALASAAPAARSSNTISRTCLSRRRCEARSPASSSSRTVAGLTQVLPELGLGDPRPEFGEVEVLEPWSPSWPSMGHSCS